MICTRVNHHFVALLGLLEVVVDDERDTFDIHASLKDVLILVEVVN